MATLLKPAPHLSLPEVEKQYRHEQHATVKSHWHIIWLLAKGKTTEEAAQTVGYCTEWVRQIVRRYNKEGPKGLADARRQNGGNRFLLTEDERETLMHIIETEIPSDGGLWTGPKVTQWIEAKIGRKIRQETGWDYLKRLGFTLKTVRPHHAKADVAAQEAFKKSYQRS